MQRVRVTKYRSIRDSGWFDVEKGKTILIGPNEAGKTALLEAIQRINPPLGTRGFDPLRDYPRSEFDDINSGKILAGDVTVVEGHFGLNPEDKEALEPEFRDCEYVAGRKLNNNFWHNLIGGPPVQRRSFEPGPRRELIGQTYVVSHGGLAFTCNARIYTFLSVYPPMSSQRCHALTEMCSLR